MLRLLQSLFGGETRGHYPESLIKMAIERTVDGTDPSLRAVSGYKKKLRPSIITAIDHVVAMTDALPPPVEVHFGSSREERPLKGYFISMNEMRNVFANDRTLAEYMQTGNAAQKITALLAMEKQERVTFGTALTGDIVTHDVPLVTIGFDAHRLIDPSGEEQTTRRNLKRRAFDHLLSLALKQLIYVKGERKELQRHHALLQAKLNLLNREGWGFDAATAKGDAKQAEQQLRDIEQQLEEFGGHYGENEAYLKIVDELLGSPEQYFISKTETVFVNQVGVKQSEPGSDVNELTFSELQNAAGRRMTVMLVTLDADEIRGLYAAEGA